MDMNTAGQLGLPLGIMLFLFSFIAAVAISAPLKEIINEARDSANLDCDNTTISDGQLATCVVVDFTLTGFIGSVIFAGLAAIFWASGAR